jgi:DNA-binding NarL/FixJ family response regulator
LHRPDVVALDLSGPLVDGPTMLKEIRRVAPRIPVVAMASDTQLERIEGIFRLGARAYLALPCPTSRIMKRLREATDSVSEQAQEPAWV